jgi:23S rRNA pseudouridine1911/1915/1917 synthase
MTSPLFAHHLPLLDALHALFPSSSRRSLQNWIRSGRVLVDGTVQLKATTQVQKDQIISLNKKNLSRNAWGIPILYEDRWMIVIDKPAGMLTVPANKKEINVFHLLKAKFKTTSLFPVHRLDQETSGVLVFARSKLAEIALSDLFEKHDLERKYMALISGHLYNSKGTWECFLREKANFDVEVTTPEFGKKAVTHYEVLRYSKKLTCVNLHLETGRKHQIRVQAAHVGHPIVGDKRYGSTLNPYKRLCLHAYHLAFVHPFTHKSMIFRSLNHGTFPFS